MAKATARSIEWRTAEVHDGTLSVELDGKRSKQWGERFTGVLERLGRSARDVSLDKQRRIVVEGVTPGKEADVRHLVESAVLQANSGLESPGDDEDGDDERSSEDDEMTAAFRAFASDD